MLWSPPPGLYGDDAPASGKMQWRDGYNIRWRLGRPETIGLWRRVLDAGGNPLQVATGTFGEARTLRVVPRTTGAQVIIGCLNRLLVATPDTVASSLSAGTRWQLHDITPADLPIISDGLGPDLGRTRVNPAWWVVPLGDAVVMGRAGVDEPVYLWGRDPSQVAVAIPGSPRGAVAAMATDNGYLVLLGCEPVVGTNSVLTVRWCSQGDVTQWDPLPSNSTAGDVLLPEGSRIVGGGSTTFGALAWTDTDLWEIAIRPYQTVFEPVRVARRAGLLGNTAWAEAGARLWWLGADNVVWSLDGNRPLPMPCPIKGTTLDTIWREAAHRTFLTGLPEHNEVAVWLPNGVDGAITGAATLNYAESMAWSRWQMPRTAMSDRCGPLRPLAIDAAGYLYEHELPAVDDTPTWQDETVERRPWSLSTCSYYASQTPEVETMGTYRVVLDRLVRHTPGDEQAAIMMEIRSHAWTAAAAGTEREQVTWYPETQHHDVRVGGRTQDFRLWGNDRSHTRLGDVWLKVQGEGERA